MRLHAPGLQCAGPAQPATGRRLRLTGVIGGRVRIGQRPAHHARSRDGSRLPVSGRGCNSHGSSRNFNSRSMRLLRPSLA